jgi:hypothetical protein
LKNYRGHLQADAYVAYDAFFTKPERGMVEVGCWAHARRHFHQAQENDPSRMRTVLLQIAQLYAVERTARERGLEGEELRLLRQHEAGGSCICPPVPACDRQTHITTNVTVRTDPGKVGESGSCGLS